MRILLAVDGSRYSADVMDAVLARFWPEAGIVRVLSAVEPERIIESSGPGSSGDTKQTPPVKATEELVEWVADSLSSHGFQAETVVKPGDPREVIVNEAASWPADLILVGAYGHSGVRTWQIGSVADSVAKHARCSVEVVRKQRTVTPDSQDM
jgi:nucleotide-binding universal stress UspA family protein